MPLKLPSAFSAQQIEQISIKSLGFGYIFSKLDSFNTALNRASQDSKKGERKSNNEEVAVSQRVCESYYPQSIRFDYGVNSASL